MKHPPFDNASRWYCQSCYCLESFADSPKCSVTYLKGKVPYMSPPWLSKSAQCSLPMFQGFRWVLSSPMKDFFFFEISGLIAGIPCSIIPSQPPAARHTFSDLVTTNPIWWSAPHFLQEDRLVIRYCASLVSLTTYSVNFKLFESELIS